MVKESSSTDFSLWSGARAGLWSEPVHLPEGCWRMSVPGREVREQPWMAAVDVTEREVTPHD